MQRKYKIFKDVFLFQACAENPCLNGGTCWASATAFYCACKPGFTGETCEGSYFTLFYVFDISNVFIYILYIFVVKNVILM